MKLAILLSIVCVCGVHAVILHVPGDYPTIQQALINAADNDTVLVASGTYYEHIVWPGTQSIVLMSESGADSTIIDASHGGIVVNIQTQVDNTTIIKGFTIKNGNTARGAGIYCNDASPTICDNIICNNDASSYAGGIYCYNSNPIIQNNVITGNTAHSGGGAMLLIFSTPRIIGNSIINNSADGSTSSGGGILTEATGYPKPLEVINNTISNNTAVYAGGGAHFYKASVYFMYNTVCNNTASNIVDGVMFHESYGVAHYNNIYDNGFGVYCDFASPSFDAENNWWGDTSGPYHATNPGGLGDTVSDYIDFIPWLYAPYGVEEHEDNPFSFHDRMLRIFPNPVRQWCAFEYTIPCESAVDLVLYDAAGKCVRKLVSEYQNPGYYKRTFNFVDQVQGVYFVKLTTVDRTEVKKVVLLK